MDIKPMMKGKEDFRSVLSSVFQIRIRIPADHNYQEKKRKISYLKNVQEN
jgi:hypothetical protein